MFAIQSAVGSLRLAGRAGLRPMLTRAPAATEAQQRCFGIKKAKKKKKQADAGGEGVSKRSKDLDLILRAIDAPVSKPPPPATEEEAQRIADIERNYVIGMFKQHNEHNHNLNCKIRMKQHAMKMLPRNSKVKEKAEFIDDEMPPPYRRYITWTPPIKDFDPSQWDFEDLEEEQ